jgi:predicted porin/outer membrane murein-binding lipoprotein Lpp
MRAPSSPLQAFGLCRSPAIAAGIVLPLLLAMGGSPRAQTLSPTEQIRALQEQINQLQRAVDKLGAAQAQSADQAKAAEAQAKQAQTQAAQAQSKVEEHIPPRPAVTASGAPYPAKGEPPGIHFDIGGQDFQVYGRAHVSGVAFNEGGLKGGTEIESNQSILGFRTARQLAAAPDDLTFIAQAEGEIAFANSPTLKNTFGFRDSFVGFQGSNWGTAAVGKLNTPYKSAQLRIDPLTNTLGDIRALFANTGGDNRVEFSVRAPHALWYISPEILTPVGSLHASVLFSPGQNPGNANQDFAFGENICAGAAPGPQGPFSSGTGQAGMAGAVGSGRGDCTDGSFGDLVSAEARWQHAGWLVDASYELHSGTNRTGDESGTLGVPPFPGSVAVHDESGVQVFFGRDWGNGWKTYLGFDSLNRSDAAKTFNERTKMDYLATVSWQATPDDKLALNYVHATSTPGDPAFFFRNNNHADMWALGYFHNFLPDLKIFAVGGMTINGQTAHYDLGAGGIAQPILARNADNTVFTGKTLYAVQLGIEYGF